MRPLTFVGSVRSSRMRLAVAAAFCIASLPYFTQAGLSQDAPARAKALQPSSVKAAPSPPQVRGDAPQITGAFSFDRGFQQERTIRQLVDAMDLRDETRRSVELQTLNETPLSTVLNLSRFLHSEPYKRKDGSPLIDLSF